MRNTAEFNGKNLANILIHYYKDYYIKKTLSLFEINKFSIFGSTVGYLVGAFVHDFILGVVVCSILLNKRSLWDKIEEPQGGARCIWH